ncbi:hypothetical protein NUACC21_05340 [Scytonema sp. NUACC21]
MFSEQQSTHTLAKFVTVEAVALRLNIEATRIKEIRLWNHVILVVAQGLSRFVSYADIPPILDTASPVEKEMLIAAPTLAEAQTKPCS